MIKGMLFAFLAAFSWGAAIVMSKKGVEELDAGGVFFWQICSAVILSWIVLFIKRKKRLHKNIYDKIRFVKRKDQLYE